MKEIFKLFMSPEQPIPDLKLYDAYRRCYTEALIFTPHEMHRFLTDMHFFDDVYEQALNNIVGIGMVDGGSTSEEWEKIEALWGEQLRDVYDYYYVVCKKQLEANDPYDTASELYWRKQADHLTHHYGPFVTDYMAHATMAIKTPAISRFELKKTLD